MFRHSGPRRPARLAGLAALPALALGLAGPAVAQSDPATSAASEQPPAVACTPGAFGEGAELDVESGDDQAITHMGVEFQCGDILSDGTYIPTGYRIYLSGECAQGTCHYPTIFAYPTAREGHYEAFFVEDGLNVTLRIRKIQRAVDVIYVGREPGDTGKPIRAAYQFRAE